MISPRQPNASGTPCVKAAAEGGGKGIRIAETPAHFAHALSEAVTEATRSFGDGRGHRRALHRSPAMWRFRSSATSTAPSSNSVPANAPCSAATRSWSKSPCTEPPDSPRPGCAPALRLAESIGYDSTGTVEFVVDDETGDYFFLEMNTRLQVEHPVTEATTGLDLVELQIRAAILPLGVAQDAVAFAGRAIEVRINAEDATNDFTPQIGQVTVLDVPDSVRWDAAIGSAPRSRRTTTR